LKILVDNGADMGKTTIDEVDKLPNKDLSNGVVILINLDANVESMVPGK